MKKNIFTTKKIAGKFYHIAFILIVTLAISCSKSSTSATPTPIPTPTVIPPINVASTTAKEIIVDMATGFNLGNTFEFNTTNNPPFFNSIKPIIDLYYDAGMRHVRIPVTWIEGFTSNLTDANGNLNTTHPRLLELKAVVDYALSKKMYVVINAHHEHWLKDYYDGTSAFDNKFRTLWTGIATFFRDEPKQLLFDVLNEPEGKMGEWSGAAGFPLPTNPAAIALTRQINIVGYDAIRATGRNNTTRVIMVEPNGQGNQGQITSVFTSKSNLPSAGTDAYLAIQVHTYDPWAFCGQTGANSAFPGNATFTNSIQKVATQAAVLDVPVNYGEFGVGRLSGTERNTDLVRGYYKLMKQTCIGQKMSCTAWDDRGRFGLINTSGSTPAFTNGIVVNMLEP